MDAPKLDLSQKSTRFLAKRHCPLHRDHPILPQLLQAQALLKKSRQNWAQDAQRFIAGAVSAQFRCQDTASYKEQKLIFNNFLAVLRLTNRVDELYWQCRGQWKELPDDGVGEQGQVKFIKRCLEFHGFQLVLLEECKRQAMAHIFPGCQCFQIFIDFRVRMLKRSSSKRAIPSSKRQRTAERKEDERDRDREGDENRGVDEQDVHHPPHAQTSDSSSPYSCSNQIQSPQPRRHTCKWIGGLSPEDALRSHQPMQSSGHVPPPPPGESSSVIDDDDQCDILGFLFDLVSISPSRGFEDHNQDPNAPIPPDEQPRP